MFDAIFKDVGEINIIAEDLVKPFKLDQDTFYFNIVKPLFMTGSSVWVLLYLLYLSQTKDFPRTYLSPFHNRFVIATQYPSTDRDWHLPRIARLPCNWALLGPLEPT